MSDIDMKAIADKVHADMARERGITVEEMRKRLAKDAAENWCHCEKEGDPVFHDDGVMPWKSCVNKHHYHCENCRKLTQVG